MLHISDDTDIDTMSINQLVRSIQLRLYRIPFHSIVKSIQPYYNHNDIHTITQYTAQQHRLFSSDTTSDDIPSESTADAGTIDPDSSVAPIAEDDEEGLIQRPNPATDGASQWLKQVPRMRGKPKLPVPIDNTVYDTHIVSTAADESIESKYKNRILIETEYEVSRRIYNDKLHSYRKQYQREINSAQQSHHSLLLQQHSELLEYRRMKQLRDQQIRRQRADKHKQRMTELAEKNRLRQLQAAENERIYQQRLNDRRVFGFTQFVLKNEYKKTSILNRHDINDDLFKQEKSVLGWFPATSTTQ